MRMVLYVGATVCWFGYVLVVGGFWPAIFGACLMGLGRALWDIADEMRLL
jgi:hypothetical protein